MRAELRAAITRRWLACLVVGACAASLMGCTGTLQHASAQHRCAQVDGADVGASRGGANCEARSLGGAHNRSAARADGEGAQARAIAGSLDLFDNGNADSYLASDNNMSLAMATNGAGALARSGVNRNGARGAGGNSAAARANGRNAFADASAANGQGNTATSTAEGCVGAPGQGCAFSVAGNGDHNNAYAVSNGARSRAQAGALDGDRNSARSASHDGGRAVSSAQGGDGNSAKSAATGDSAFASAQSTGGESLALSRANGAELHGQRRRPARRRCACACRSWRRRHDDCDRQRVFGCGVRIGAGHVSERDA